MTLDRYVDIDSPIQRLDPRLKLLATLAFVVGNVLLPDGAWLAFGLSWMFTVGVSTLARLGPTFALRRSYVALPFALAGLTVLFRPEGHLVFNLALGPLQAAITDLGIERFLTLMLRTWTSVQMALLLSATTSLPDLMHALRHLRVPAVLTAIIGFMVRFLFVLAEEASRLITARAARSAAAEGRRAGGSLPWRARVAGGMAGQLLVRSLDRAERVHSAMLARGFDGELLTLRPHALRQRDWLVGVIVVAGLAVIQLAGRWP